MAVKRMVANFATESPSATAEFYRDLLELDVVMGHGWIMTLASEEAARVQLGLASEGGSGTPVPDLSIEVDDLERVLERAGSMQLPIVYGPISEP